MATSFSACLGLIVFFLGTNGRLSSEDRANQIIKSINSQYHLKGIEKLNTFLNKHHGKSTKADLPLTSAIVIFKVTEALRAKDFKILYVNPTQVKSLFNKNIDTVARNADEKKYQNLVDDNDDNSLEGKHGIAAILISQPKKIVGPKMQTKNKIINDYPYKLTNKLKAKSASVKSKMDFLRSWERKSCARKCKRATSRACEREGCESKLEKLIKKRCCKECKYRT